MADTNYGVNHPLAQKLWAKTLFHDAIGATYVGKFMGEGPNNILQIKTETKKDAGDRITIGLRSLLTGSGIQGDATQEGNEEALSTFADNIFIDQLRHAVRSQGEMSEQRVPWSVREEAKDGLRDWWAERMDVAFANQLTGNTGQGDTRFTGNQAAVAPTAGSRLIIGNSHTGEASLSATTTHAIKLADLDKAVALAKTTGTARQRIRPAKISGEDYYVCFLHPDQIFQLRRDASTQGNFWDLARAQLQGGKIKDNPLVNGASFMYNNVIVHEWSYLPNSVGATAVAADGNGFGGNTAFRRGVFCGAQAAAIAFGQNSAPTKMSWVEETFDYKNKLGVCAGSIFGVKKMVFNSIDFGTIVLSGYAPPQAA